MESNINEEEQQFKKLQQELMNTGDTYSKALLKDTSMEEMVATSHIDHLIDTKAALKRLHNRIKNKENFGKRSQRFADVHTIKPLLVRIISAACLIMAFGWIVWDNMNPSGLHKQMSTNKWETVTTGLGLTSNITFPDGTHVRLGPQSRLDYPSAFSKNNRVVKLIGEAYFDVAKDPSRPFIVESRSLQTKVLGTRFLIESYPESKSSQVTLIEGKVEVSANKALSCILKPNQAFNYNSDTHTGKLVIVDPVMANGHALGHIIFDNNTMEEVGTKLSRIYNVEFEFRDNALKSLRVSGEFEKIALGHIMDVLKSSNRLSYKFDHSHRKVIIKKKHN